MAAQHELHHVPPVVNPEGDNPDFLHPFIDPLAFDPDYQFFAPADVSNYGDGPEANTGWFATYDKVRMYMTRPDYVESYTEGDFTWGNRFDVGYMTCEDHGWLISFWNIDGPNAFDTLVQERVNVYNSADVINGSPGAIILRGGDEVDDLEDGVLPPEVVFQDANDAVTGNRDYRIQNSLNVAEITSMELNKTFRFHQMHYGSWVEPFCGVRYLKFSSMTEAETYSRFDPDTALRLELVMPPAILDDAEAASIEQFIANSTQWDNHMVGGQLGFRWFKQKSHWLLSADVRAFAFDNFQSFRQTTNIITTYYGAVGVDEEVSLEQKSRSGFDDHDSEFVLGTEIRAEAAYAISKALSLRAGIAFMEFGKGVARSNSFFDNSEDVTMIGYTFGATLNR